MKKLALLTYLFSAITLNSVQAEDLQAVKKDSSINPMKVVVTEDPVEFSQRRVPLDPILLEREILESPTQKTFDSDEWKNSIDARQSMLLSLLRANLFGKNRAQVGELLGTPLEAIERVGQSSDSFDLGKFKDENLRLVIAYYQGKLCGLMIAQYSDVGYLRFIPGKWFWKNPDSKNIAKDFNEACLVVGAPTQHLCQIFGHPEKQGNIWKAGPFEMEYTPDGKKVQKFRMVPEGRMVSNTTDWETSDLRQIEGSCTSSMEVHLRAEETDAVLVKPLMKFDRARWDKVWNRDFMLFDITHNFQLVGKTRSAIREYLGEPYLSETKNPPEYRERRYTKRFAAHKPFIKFDWYALRGTGCDWPSDPGLHLEIVYKEKEGNTLVAGYRLLQSDVYADGIKEFPGTGFSPTYGICQPAEKKAQKPN